MTPIELINKIRAWQPVAYLIIRGLLYTASVVFGAITAWYGDGPQPDWLPRSIAVVMFLTGSLALVNLTKRPGRVTT